MDVKVNSLIIDHVGRMGIVQIVNEYKDEQGWECAELKVWYPTEIFSERIIGINQVKTVLGVLI